MPSQTKFPGTISQTTGTDRVSFSSLNNLKNENNTYAKTAKIGKKTDTKKRPAIIQCSNFGFSLPKGAEVTRIIVKYGHQTLDDVQGKYPSIAAPDITLKNTGMNSAHITYGGNAPSKTYKDRSKTWNGQITATQVIAGEYVTVKDGSIVTKQPKTKEVIVYYDLPKRIKINNSNFGVHFNYPANTSANKGYLQLKYVKVQVDYIVPAYDLKVSRVGTGDILQWDKVKFKIEVSNKNLSKYMPDFTIVLPEGTSIVNVTGNVGVFARAASTGSSYFWSPTGMHTDESFTQSASGSWTLELELSFNILGNKSITISESLTNAYSELTGIIINPIPTEISGSTDLVDKERIIFAKQNTQFQVTLQVPKAYLVQENITSVYLFSNKTILWNNSTLTDSNFYSIPLSNFNEDGEYVTNFTSAIVGETLLYLATEPNRPETPYMQVKVISSSYTYPEICIIKLTEEETNRLGEGFTYSVISDAMLITANSSSIEDHYRNYRLGVVNSINETDNLQSIFDACQSWSHINTTIMNYEELSADFIYNEDYPVYIIFTGDYHEFENYTLTSFRFSTPNIVAKDTEYAKEYAVFPEPILNIADADSETIGSMTIDSYNTSNNIILYGFPFEDGFGTNKEYAIRGMAIELECDVDAQLVANAVVRNANGVIGQESIILTPGTSQYMLGNEFDTWGFRISELNDLNKFEVELSFSNINEGTLVNLDISNLRFIVHYLRLDNDLSEKVYIDGENLEWYGACIKEFEVPFGAKTDTKYLNITGTDINDSYLMTIKEKEIKIKFDVDGCNLEESTELLKQITKLFSNKRDELNRPIPKRVESTFNTDEYYEYIMEDGITAEIKISSYECEAKLTIPAGTSFKVNDTVTNLSGVVSSIAKVNPWIVLIPQSDTIEIVEEFSEQKFNLGYEGMTGKFVELDCEHQIAWLRDDADSEPINISSLVDYNSDWFALDGQYRFIPTNCMIQSVTFTERGG